MRISIFTIDTCLQAGALFETNEMKETCMVYSISSIILLCNRNGNPPPSQQPHINPKLKKAAFLLKTKQKAKSSAAEQVV